MRSDDIEMLDKILAGAGLHKIDLAKAMGRDPSAVTALYQGRRELKLSELDKIAGMLSMSTGELINRLRGQATMEWDDEIYISALTRAKETVRLAKVKLAESAFAEFTYLLYKHALSEKKSEGKASLTQATANLLLNQKMLSATG